VKEREIALRERERKGRREGRGRTPLAREGKEKEKIGNKIQ
jgi:hypothetical protein